MNPEVSGNWDALLWEQMLKCDFKAVGLEEVQLFEALLEYVLIFLYFLA